MWQINWFLTFQIKVSPYFTQKTIEVFKFKIEKFFGTPYASECSELGYWKHTLAFKNKSTKNDKKFLVDCYSISVSSELVIS